MIFSKDSAKFLTALDCQNVKQKEGEEDCGRRQRANFRRGERRRQEIHFYIQIIFPPFYFSKSPFPG
jgi:hypothetical protein